jgi:predicted MFS family arabinose efflux permease
MTRASTSASELSGRGRLPRVIGVMAAAAGLIGANIHYNQPLLPAIAAGLELTPAAVGILPAVTQAGFAISLLILLPLADSLDRRRLILASVAVAALAMLAQSVAPNLPLLLIAAFVAGAASVAPQILSPFAAAVAPPGREGQAAGIVLSGILLGVLLSKVVAGIVGSVLDWRALFALAAALMVVLFAVLWWKLPRVPKGPPQSFPQLVASPLSLLRRFPTLRLHSLLGALVSAAFMLFWSTYAIHLFEQFGYGVLVAGLFGIAGIVGSLLAPVAGRAVDRGKAPLTLMIAAALVAVAFILMWAAPASVVGLVVGIVLLDAGVGLTHSSNQGRIFRLDAARRGRLNSVYMFSYFMGGAVGSLLGVAALGVVGWAAVCLIGFVIGLALLVTIVVGYRSIALLTPQDALAAKGDSVA